MTTDLPDHLQRALGAAYVIERELGGGGMSRVFVATETALGRPVVIKVLAPELAHEISVERFRREILVAARLQHPHIVPLLAAGDAGGCPYYTMPLVDGDSLRARLARSGELPIEEAVRILRDVAKALAFAHRHGVVHRDIKPDNILVADESAMVTDFGVAKAVLDATTAHDTLTSATVAIGTPAYMAPEQAVGDPATDHRADIYAFGVVAYELMTGHPPFAGRSTQAVLAAHSVEVPESVTRLRPALAPVLGALIMRCLEKRPADRPQTAEELARTLGAVLTPGAGTVGTGASGEGRATAVMARRHARPRWLVVAGLSGIAACVGAGLLLAVRHRATDPPVATAAAPVGVAVLPFETQGDTANAYFADGITGEIQGRLAALPGLRVIASTSANQYRHSRKPPDQIGRELGVHYLLIGRIQWEQGLGSTKRVRVSPELVEVRDGATPDTKWQHSYDTTLADVFDVQSAVATQVASRLGVVLTAPAQAQLAARPTQNLAAYDAYLRSEALYYAGTDVASIRRALTDAERAIALDSTFAAAWAIVSNIHSYLYRRSQPTRADAEAARLAADRSIALAPTTWYGYRARGRYLWLVAHDLPAARAAFETAVRLEPSSSIAFIGLASVEEAAGMWGAALDHARQAVVLDPRSSAAAERLCITLRLARRTTEARAEAMRGLTLEPENLDLILFRALTLLDEGDLAGAQVTLRDVSPMLNRAVLIASLGPPIVWVLDSADRDLLLTLPPSAVDNDRAQWGMARARVYWFAGDTIHARLYADSARVAVEMHLRTAPDIPVLHQLHGLALAYLGRHAAAVVEGERAVQIADGDLFEAPSARHDLAEIYALTGDRARAVDQLETAVTLSGDYSPAWLRVDPGFASLRGDPRFERLIARPMLKPLA